MTSEPTPSALRDLRALFDAGTTAGLSDDQLLRRYADRRADAEAQAQAAFAALVDRHGPMVWGVCRRALGGAHAAEDAFQATFLVLARRADAVRVDGSLGRWLHGVASKVASRARADGLRRRAKEQEAAAGRPTARPPDPGRDELLAALDEELGRLPEKYRSPMVLCHLEGLSYAGAAERLGCPAGAVKGRLARGRDLLRARLTRRGLGLPASVAEGSIIPDARPAVPAWLARSAGRAAPGAGSPATVAGVSTSALHLADGAIRTMLLTRSIKLLALLTPAPALVGFWLLATVPARENGPGPREPLAAIDEPDRASAIAVRLPSRPDLRLLLRRAAGEAIAIASKEPASSSYALSAIAKAQASAGDLPGARETLAAASRAAGGELGGEPRAYELWRVGHVQAEAGLRDDARATLRRAFRSCPWVVGQFGIDQQTMRHLASLVEDQAGIGDVEGSRTTADRLKAFAAEFFATSGTANAEEFFASELAGALAAVDDFEGAFRRAGSVFTADGVISKAALSASKTLDRDHARRFVDEAVARMASIEAADRRYSGLSDLAEARARVGDIEGAKDSARSIGEGPTRVDYDMTDGQPFALLRIARVQREAGQAEAARETLREAYRRVVDRPRMRGPEGRFLQVAGAQVVAGDLDGALRSAEAVPEGQRAETLAGIARAHAIAGRVEEARETIKRALADARKDSVAHPAPDPRPEPAPALRAGEARPFPPDASATMRLAEIRAMAGDVGGALETLGAIVDENYRRLALEKVVSARAAAGDVQGAFDLATKDGRTTTERRMALQGLGEGVEARLRMESP